MENEVTNSTNEVDVVGGWLVTHWTKTWDTRAPLTGLQDQLVQAQKDADLAQTRVMALQENIATFDKAIADASAQQVQTAPTDPTDPNA